MTFESIISLCINFLQELNPKDSFGNSLFCIWNVFRNHSRSAASVSLYQRWSSIAGAWRATNCAARESFYPDRRSSGIQFRWSHFGATRDDRKAVGTGYRMQNYGAWSRIDAGQEKGLLKSLFVLSVFYWNWIFKISGPNISLLKYKW